MCILRKECQQASLSYWLSTPGYAIAFFLSVMCKLYAAELLVPHSVLMWVNLAESEETIAEYFKSSSLPVMSV